jgi:hypothetical protein
MFEEIPPERRGLARVRARRFVLGPFVVGGGLVLALLGGSVAVAATVITASTIGLSNPAPRHAPSLPVVPAVTHTSTHATAAVGGASRSPTGSMAPASGPSVGNTAPSAAGKRALGPIGSASPSRTVPKAPTSDHNGPVASATRSGESVAAPHPTGGASASGSTTTSSPAGNAAVYVSGYDADQGRIEFEYAVVSPGTGVGGSDVYSVASTVRYSAAISPEVGVTSGGLICPPAGSACTSSELIQAAMTGFFAEVALDPSGVLLSVIERDNVSFSGANPSPTSSSATVASASDPVATTS